MPPPTSKRGPLANVDAKFISLLEKLRESSDLNYREISGLQKRVWMYPELNGWTGDPQDIPGANQAFDRTMLNQIYDIALTSSGGRGKVGDCAATKIQVDYIATAERAFRTRHATRIRSMMHAAGRRCGHGEPNKGLYVDSVIPYITGIIKETAMDTQGVATA